MEVAIGCGIHQIDERSIAIGGQELIPFATPHNFDDVPAGPTEQTLKFLDDFSIPANWAVEALQVAVDNEDQIIELFAGGKADGTDCFNFVHLSIAQERPNFLLGRILDAAMG